MGGGRRQGAAPWAESAGMRAAIDDQRSRPTRHLEAERAGMGIGVEAAAAAPCPYPAPASRPASMRSNPVWGALHQGLDARAGVGLGQHRPASRLAPAPPLNSDSPPSPWRKKRSAGRHAVDGVLKHFRHLAPRRAQDRPDVDQVAQHQHVRVPGCARHGRRRAASGGGSSRFEQLERLAQAPVSPPGRPARRRRDPGRRRTAPLPEAPRGRPRQVARLRAARLSSDAVAELGVARRPEEIVLPEPVGDARRRAGRARQGAQLQRVVLASSQLATSVARAAAAPRRRRRRAGRAASRSCSAPIQPAPIARRRGAQTGAAACIALAGEGEIAIHDRGAARGVARPRVGRRQAGDAPAAERRRPA